MDWGSKLVLILSFRNYGIQYFAANVQCDRIPVEQFHQSQVCHLWLTEVFSHWADYVTIGSRVSLVSKRRPANN